jgi:hypothetical protein
MIVLLSIRMEVIMLKKRVKYYNISEIRFYQLSLKLEIKYPNKTLQEIEN